MALIGKNNHQSVLDDDASIFQTQEERTEKQKWSQLDNHQRLHYFTDYYLFKCLIFIILIGVTGVIIWTVTKPQKERKIFFAVVHNSLIPEKKEELTQQFTNMFVTDPKRQEIRIDDSFPFGYESDAKLSAYLSAQEIDLLVTNEEHFKTLAKNDCFEDLNDIIPEFAAEHTNFLYYTEGYVEEEYTEAEDADQNINAKASAPKNLNAYGINVTDFDIIKESWYQEEPAIIGIVKNCPQKENAITILKNIFT